MNTQKTILVGIAAGLFSAWIKSIAEPHLQKSGLKIFPATENELQIKGADIKGHPENMPPAVFSKKVFAAFTGDSFHDQYAVKIMPIIHYFLGVFFGVAYAFGRKNNSFVRSGQGTLAGVTMFALTHGSSVPALKLQGKVSKMPKSWWVWEFGSYLVFGVALEQSVKFFKKMF